MEILRLKQTEVRLFRAAPWPKSRIQYVHIAKLQLDDSGPDHVFLMMMNLEPCILLLLLP